MKCFLRILLLSLTVGIGANNSFADERFESEGLSESCVSVARTLGRIRAMTLKECPPNISLAQVNAQLGRCSERDTAEFRQEILRGIALQNTVEALYLNEVEGYVLVDENTDAIDLSAMKSGVILLVPEKVKKEVLVRMSSGAKGFLMGIDFENKDHVKSEIVAWETPGNKQNPGMQAGGYINLMEKFFMQGSVLMYSAGMGRDFSIYHDQYIRMYHIKMPKNVDGVHADMFAIGGSHLQMNTEGSDGTNSGTLMFSPVAAGLEWRIKFEGQHLPSIAVRTLMGPGLNFGDFKTLSLVPSIGFGLKTTF